MTKYVYIFLILLNLSLYSFGQTFVESNEFKLTEIDYEKYATEFEEGGTYDKPQKIYLTDLSGNKLKFIEVSPEFYQDAIVEEAVNVDFKNIRKILRVFIDVCACYCETSKYYWIVTNDGQLIDFPTIEQGIYDFDLVRLDYEFDSSSDSINLIQYQDEAIKENDNDYPILKIKSKKVLKNLKWNGTDLN